MYHLNNYQKVKVNFNDIYSSNENQYAIIIRIIVWDYPILLFLYHYERDLHSKTVG